MDHSAGYCQGDECPGIGAMPGRDDCTAYQVAILVTSGVTCLLLVLDLAARYLGGKKEEEEKDKPVEVVEPQIQAFGVAPVGAAAPGVQATGFGLEPITEMDKEVLSGEAKPQVTFTKKAEIKEVPDSDGEEGVSCTDSTTSSPPPSSLSYHLNDLVTALRTSVQVDVPNQDVPEECQEKLKEITSLKDPCNTLSCEFDQLSVSLVRPSTEQSTEAAPGGETEEDRPEADRDAESNAEQGQQSLAAFQKQSAALKNQWNSIRRLLFCADVHLRNATNYQQFFYDVKAVQKSLKAFHDSIKEKTDKDPKQTKSPEDFKKSIEEFQQVLADLRLWQSTVQEISDRSHHIVPVHKRTEILEEPYPIRALCTYQSPELSVNEGDSLMLIQNDDSNAWNVRDAEGNEGTMPALCCLVPPPDSAALNTANKLKQNLSATYSTTEAWLQKSLLQIIKDTLKGFVDSKDKYFAVLKDPHRQELGDKLQQLHDIIQEEFTEQEGCEEVQNLSDKLKEIVDASSTQGNEYDKLDKDVIDVIDNLFDLLGINESLQKSQKAFKAHNFNQASEDSIDFDSDWDTLDELDAPQQEKGLGISVQRSTTEVGESSSITASQGEVRQTFSIGAVVDPRNNEEISIQDAIERGLLKPDRGVFYNPVLNEEYPIPIAMNAGFILVESTQTKTMREHTQAVGIVSVKITRETRPYTITKVLNPETNEPIPVSEAVAKGIFNSETGMWSNPENGQEMNVQDAIDTGHLVVEYDEDAKADEPEVIERTFAIYGVLDRKQEKRIPFFEACEKGLIDKDAGQYFDNLTGKSMAVTEAVGKGWVKARVVTDPSELENIMSKRLSGSTSSLSSDRSN